MLLMRWRLQLLNSMWLLLLVVLITEIIETNLLLKMTLALFCECIGKY